MQNMTQAELADTLASLQYQQQLQNSQMLASS